MTSASGPQERVPQVPPTGDQKEIFRNLGGQVRSTVKEIVSVLRGHRQGAEIPGDPPEFIRKTTTPVPPSTGRTGAGRSGTWCGTSTPSSNSLA